MIVEYVKENKVRLTIGTWWSIIVEIPTDVIRKLAEWRGE